MAVLFLDSAQKSLPKTELMIITPRNKNMLQDFLSAYPRINLVEVNRRNFLRALFILAKISLRKTLVINSVSFGKVPFLVRVLGVLLTIRPRSKLAMFSDSWRGKFPDGDFWGNKIAFDYKKIVYENLTRLFNVLGFNISKTVPIYNFISDEGVLLKYNLASEKYVVIHPSAFVPKRSLPANRWSEIFKYVSDNFPNMKIAITGSREDLIFIQKIMDGISSEIQTANLTGRLEMAELAKVIDNCKFYIGADTGISHLAGVLRKKSLIIGNLSNPSWLPTYNENAVILTNDENCTCDGKKGGDCFYVIDGEKYYRCMIDINQEDIYGNITKILAKKNL